MLLVVWCLAALLTQCHAGCRQCPASNNDNGDSGSTSSSSAEANRRLWRQLMLDQHAQEERMRSEGDSGLKQVRIFNRGYRSWAASSHVDASEIASIHSHADHVRTVGLGEFVAVLNGVEFRTRHNDYLLKKPSTSPTSGYHETEDIEYPSVPPSVLRMNSVEAQAQEMREYFKAFKNNDISHRDFRPYFKPILCYMEGAWTLVGEDLEEPFDSDRHFIDAQSWYDLQQKVMFLSASGRKDPAENVAHLPTRVVGLREDGTPIIAQWIYRILCHEIKPVNNRLTFLYPRMLSVIEEMKPLTQSVVDLDRFGDSRQARFRLLPPNGDERNDGFLVQTPLQMLMQQIPGKDNYRGNLTDSVGGNTVNSISQRRPLNTAYYHSAYAFAENDAMGVDRSIRSFSDATVHMAMTSHEEIAAFEWQECYREEDTREFECYDQVSQRWTYAIPLEIIYLTPLHEWNPYNIPYRGSRNSAAGRTVEANGRFGGFTQSTAFNGNHDRTFYRVPSFFFTAEDLQENPADTNAGIVGVLDSQGVVRNVSASGVHVLQPNIPGVGVVRQRYPVMPLYKEGDATWKELEALKDYTFELIEQYFPDLENGTSTGLLLRIMPSTRRARQHQHTAFISAAQVEELYNSEQVSAVTSQENGHAHQLMIRRNAAEDTLEIQECDGETSVGEVACFDGHPVELISDAMNNAEKRKRRNAAPKFSSARKLRRRRSKP